MFRMLGDHTCGDLLKYTAMARTVGTLLSNPKQDIHSAKIYQTVNYSHLLRLTHMSILNRTLTLAKIYTRVIHKQDINIH